MTTINVIIASIAIAAPTLAAPSVQAGITAPSIIMLNLKNGSSIVTIRLFPIIIPAAISKRVVIRNFAAGLR